MLIKALCDYADAQEVKTGEVSSDDFTTQNVNFRIMLTEEGDIAEIFDLRKKNDNGKKKDVLVPSYISLPKRTQKSGIDANIIEHRPRYIFGLNAIKGENGNIEFTPDDKTGKAKNSHDAFIKKNLEFCEEIDSVIVRAYCNFIRKWNPENETNNKQLLKYAKEYSSSYFSFGLDGYINCNLEEDEKLISKYKGIISILNAENDDAVLAFCPIQGENLPSARIHDKIKGIKNANSTGAILVGMKETAFQSYGKTQSYNSGISEIAMRKYTATLNKLLADQTHRMYLDDMTLIYFAISSDDNDECKLFNDYIQGPDDDNLEKSISSITNQMTLGKTGDLSCLQVDEGLTFYVIGLTPNSSRISQKFCIRNSFGYVMRNIIQHQVDIKVKDDGKQVPIYKLTRELISPKSSKETVSPALISSLFSAILNGTQYPYALLETIIRRIKTDSDEEKNMFIKINDRRIGIIKAYLNRNARLNNKKEEIGMALDKTYTNQAYLCGRLFAVLENTQSNALGNLNRTIKDAYFSSACTKPMDIFPQLIRLSLNHFKKIQKDKPGIYDKNTKIYKEIFDKLDKEFPKILTLEEQGIFIIGYQHQMNDIFTKKDSIENKED